MKDRAAIVCFLVGLGLILVGAYVHVTTVADIPEAAMTLRLEWSGWEWGAGAIFFFFLTWCFREAK
jgi:hypothetical protein